MKGFILKIIYKVLAEYAKAVIKKHNPFVVAITGSVGKTSTKEAIDQVLADHFGRKEVGKTAGNLNAEIGIPLTILGYQKLPNKYYWPVFLLLAFRKIFVKKYPRYLILEMGVEHKGDIEYFCSIVKPDIAVITSVSAAHLLNFDSLAEYQQEKISLIYNLKPQGVAIVNGDDENLFKIRSERIKTVSLNRPDSDFFVENYEIDLDGTDYRIETLGNKISVKSTQIGKQSIYSGLFAFAVGKVMDLPLISVGKSLEKIKPINGRFKILKGKLDTILIDDTYNSNPTSCKAALEALRSIKHSGRKVAIIGNMNELGEMEKEAHLEVADYAIGKCDLAIFAGPNAEAMARKFGSQGKAFSNRSELIQNIDSILKRGDLVLIKASQNKNFFEEITKYLLADQKEAKNVLVRQDKFWDRKKNSY